jgi:type III pantothenate kinase
MATSRERTVRRVRPDQPGACWRSAGHHRRKDIGQVVVSSVVPPLHPVLDRWLRTYFHHEPLWIEPGIRTGLKVLLDNPLTNWAPTASSTPWPGIALYGAAPDRRGLRHRHHLRRGQATNREYLGGVISPGLKHQRRGAVPAGLPAAPGGDRRSRPRLVGHRAPSRPCSRASTTATSGLVDGILARLLEAYPGSTGGRHRRPGPGHRPRQQATSSTSPRDLTLEGLRLLWQKNRKPVNHGQLPLIRLAQDRFHPGLPGAAPGTGGMLRRPGRRARLAGHGRRGNRLAERPRRRPLAVRPRCRSPAISRRAWSCSGPWAPWPRLLEPWSASLGLEVAQRPGGPAPAAAW